MSYGDNNPVFQASVVRVYCQTRVGKTVEQVEKLAAVIRYIHLNAIDAGIVKMPEDYRWASHRYYRQTQGAPIWLDTAQGVEQIGGRQAFHEFVLSGNEESLKRYYEAKRDSIYSKRLTSRNRLPTQAIAAARSEFERAARSETLRAPSDCCAVQASKSNTGIFIKQKSD